MAARDVFGIVGTTQAGNFHVERVVAEGGFGVVYRAQHGAFRAPVALKCLKIPEQMTKQQRAVFLEKFREEAELMFRLSAAITEVVRPLHVDVLQLPDGRFVPFLALEWLEGESLDGIIVRRRESGQAPLGLHKVVKMLRPVASALGRAHRFPGPQGAVSIIHRDLKPENIFLANIGGTESMKVLDFGIAKAKRAASQAVGRITGRTLQEDEGASFTPAYGAPEQWSPKTYGETGPWTDVWGLALCMVEALCGTPPIDGDTYVMRRQCLDEKRRPTPRALGADVPIEVDRVFEKALSVDPRKRFKDIESFWSELETSMGLEPSLRTRDARREPSEPGAAGEAEAVFDKGRPGQEQGAGGARLGRVELVKVPAIMATPAIESLDGPSPLPRAADLRGVEAPAGLRREEIPEGPRGEAAVGARRREEPAALQSEEDWASLGLGDGPASAKRQPSARRAPDDDLEAALPMAEAPAPAQLSAPSALAPPAVRAPSGVQPNVRPPSGAQPAVRAPSDPRPAVRPPSGAQPAVRAPSGSFPAVRSPSGSFPAVRSPSGSFPAVRAPSDPRPAVRPPSSDLEIELPMQGEAPPAQAPARNSSVDLELSLPTADQGALSSAVDGIGPTKAAHALVRPIDAAALDFELSVGSRPARPGPAAGAPPTALQRQAADAARARPNAPAPRAAAPSIGDDTSAPGTGERLRAPLGLLVASLAVALVDYVVHQSTGNSLELGPVRLSWIAAPLAVIGVGFLLWRLIGVHADE